MTDSNIFERLILVELGLHIDFNHLLTGRLKTPGLEAYCRLPTSTSLMSAEKLELYSSSSVEHARKLSKFMLSDDQFANSPGNAKYLVEVQANCL